jgi:Domain of unknown function (DUF4145)
MKCPHCLESFHPQFSDTALQGYADVDSQEYRIVFGQCPACRRTWIRLRRVLRGGELAEAFVYPKTVSRQPLSQDVPGRFADDYREACMVLADSEKASAALSRRCLQALLREQAKVKPQDLSKEIDEVLAGKQLPSHLAGAIDAVRNVGNFAAHPIKSKSTGEIVEVESGEAEWLLDVLEGLFDFYFVAPAELQRKRDALNKKLADANKPPLKK